MYDNLVSLSAHRDGHPDKQIARALARCNIQPIDAAFLEQHCAEQIALNPPSWFVRHPVITSFITTSFATVISGTLCFCVAVMASDFLIEGNLMLLLGIIASLVALTFVLIAFLFDAIKVRGYARWVESSISIADVRREVPIQIADKAIDLIYEIAGAQMIIGRLVQDDAYLDPYLVVVIRDYRIIIGVWDGDKIIA